jgi:hypothetical protein
MFRLNLHRIRENLLPFLVRLVGKHVGGILVQAFSKVFLDGLGDSFLFFFA